MPDDEVRADEIEEEDDWGGPDEGGPEEPQEASDSAAAAKRRNTMLALLAALVIAAGAGWYFVYGPGNPPPPPPPVVEAAPEPAAPAEPEPELPTLDRSDRFLRSLFAALTDNGDALAWLLQDDLARRIAVATDNVADGMSPRRALASLSPPLDSFRVGGEGEMLHVHPAAFARYDAVAAVLEGTDSPGTARVIREALPIFEAAYAELGRPDRTFAGALLAALDRLAAVPLPEAPVLLDEEILRYEYRDPALEDLDDASKHLLRFGPENQARVQEAARGLAERLRAGGAPF